MMKKTRKFFGLLLVAIMVLGMGTVAFASEYDFQTPALDKLSKEGITAVKDGQGENISPTLWPGDGPAPQVTDIQLADYGWLENGNFGVIIKVYGYGSDNTTFDGQRISWIESEPFIISGTGADGFYYLYDCGPITQEGDYIFATTFTSTNFPYSQRSYSTTFTFTNN